MCGPPFRQYIFANTLQFMYTFSFIIRSQKDKYTGCNGKVVAVKYS